MGSITEITKNPDDYRIILTLPERYYDHPAPFLQLDFRNYTLHGNEKDLNQLYRVAKQCPEPVYIRVTNNIYRDPGLWLAFNYYK